MKVKNIFKKSKKETAVKTQTLDKKQLEKVAGGIDPSTGDRWQAQGIGHTITF